MHNKNFKILITGASGFVGKRLCEKLNEEGYSLLTLDSKIGNIADSEYFTDYLNEDIDYIFHLAANTFVPYSWEVPQKFIETNTLGTLQVLEFAKKKRIPITYVSAFVYGNAEIKPIKELHRLRPNNPYALSKKLAEDICLFYVQYHGLKVIIVRPFNIYGPGQSDHFLLPLILKQIANSNVVEVKSLAPKRDYIYIDDAVKLLINTMSYHESGIFNAGSGVSYSVKEVIEALAKVFNKTVTIKSVEEMRVNEITNTIADITNAKEELNWTPKISLQQGLTLMSAPFIKSE